jgi:hypothetical protein
VGSYHSAVGFRRARWIVLLVVLGGSPTALGCDACRGVDCPGPAVTVEWTSEVEPSAARICVEDVCIDDSIVQRHGAKWQASVPVESLAEVDVRVAFQSFDRRGRVLATLEGQGKPRRGSCCLAQLVMSQTDDGQGLAAQ